MPTLQLPEPLTSGDAGRIGNPPGKPPTTGEAGRYGDWGDGKRQFRQKVKRIAWAVLLFCCIAIPMALAAAFLIHQFHLR